MIVWGGVDQNFVLSTGGRYNPGTDNWASITIANAPSGREFHTAVWTGTDMIVWGGYDGSAELNTGGRYHPDTHSWLATSTTNSPRPENFTLRCGQVMRSSSGAEMAVSLMNSIPVADTTPGQTVGQRLARLMHPILETLIV
jgi:hypothetical protein